MQVRRRSVASARPPADVGDGGGDRSSGALSAALLAGAPDAARRAWADLSPVATRILRRYFGPGPDRQDLCQEAFLRLFARIGELRDPSALQPFFIGICLGVAQNELRRLRVRRWIGLTPTGELPEVAGPPADPEARQAAVRFYRILADVGAEDRALFIARHVEKLELGEMAIAFARPLSTIKRRLARANRRIGARLGRDAALLGYVERFSPPRTVKV
jgi:RNA polymerase sigma-70 factor (ECF subfamily)